MSTKENQRTDLDMVTCEVGEAILEYFMTTAEQKSVEPGTPLLVLPAHGGLILSADANSGTLFCFVRVRGTTYRVVIEVKLEEVPA